MIMMDYRLAILTRKLIKACTKTAIFFEGVAPPQTPPATRLQPELRSDCNLVAGLQPGDLRSQPVATKVVISIS